MKPIQPPPPTRTCQARHKKLARRSARENLLTHLLTKVRRGPNNPALLTSRSGAVRSISFQRLLDHVEAIASGLLHMGIRKGNRVGLLSENRPEWILADLGIMASGAVTVPIYNTLSPQQMAYQLKHSRTKILFVSRGAHLRNLLAIRAKLPLLERLILLEERLPDDLHHPDLSFHELIELGDTHRRPLEALAARTTLSDPATVVYTSGTASHWPKGVLLTHGNFLAERQALQGIFPLQEGDVVLSFLPLAHILQRVVDMVTLLGSGTVAYCGTAAAIPDQLRLFRPHLLVGVPRTYEKIRDLVVENLLYSAPPLKEVYQRIFRWLEGEYLRRERGRPAGPGIGLPVQWMKKGVLKRIRDRLGGRVRYCFCAGAPLSRDLEAFFEIIQMPLFNVYGMTELTGAVTANSPGSHKPGTVGLPLAGCEVRLALDGEILVRGAVVTPGYDRGGRAPEKATDAEGWFATGDIGSFDEDGFLIITGRKKELLITAAGKNIAPLPIESKLRRNPFIHQAMVVGDGRRYLAALIVPAFSRLEAYAARKRILCLDRRELVQHPQIRALYQEIIDEINKELSRFETLKRFALLPERFTQEAGELTPTNRLRRDIVERHYRAEIDEMY